MIPRAIDWKIRIKVRGRVRVFQVLAPNSRSARWNLETQYPDTMAGEVLSVGGLRHPPAIPRDPDGRTRLAVELTSGDAR